MALVVPETGFPITILENLNELVAHHTEEEKRQALSIGSQYATENAHLSSTLNPAQRDSFVPNQRVIEHITFQNKATYSLGRAARGLMRMSR
jgi:hypothetical protein